LDALHLSEDLAIEAVDDALEKEIFIEI